MSIRVLVVEDDFLIAIEISQQLADAGFEIVGPAASVAGASEFVDSCDVAVLNFILGNETSEPIARRLQTAGKPFVLLSGYSTNDLQALFDGTTILTKPSPWADLVAAVREAGRPKSNLTGGSL
jgi:DNA-binding response OmpR family regulator